jgi:4-aminobutyrate--pyruvate transaminase
MSKVFFGNSGSDANDTVVKMVWYFNNALGRPQKKKIVSRIKGYHGVTVASASLTGLPNNHRDFDLPIANILHTDCPHWYRFGQPGESEVAFATRVAESLEALIEREGPDTIAAFIAEPIQGAGGVILPPRGYWEKIQPILRKHDILLIADEVICGFGRTGNMFGSTTFGIEPDILTCAKALSSSYLPIAAVMVNERVFQTLVTQSEKIGTFAHGYTYTGHPVCSAVALETLRIYEERDILGHVAVVGPRLQAGLRRFVDHPLVGEVRGTALIGAVEIVENRETRASFDPKKGVGAQFMKFAHHHGLLLRALGDTVAFCPPLIIDETDIDRLITRFGKALDDTHGWVKAQGWH